MRFCLGRIRTLIARVRVHHANHCTTKTHTFNIIFRTDLRNDEYVIKSLKVWCNALYLLHKYINSH